MDLFFGKRRGGGRRPSQPSSSDDEDDYEVNDIADNNAGESDEPKQQSRNMKLAIRTVSAAINADNQVPDDRVCCCLFVNLDHYFISFY